MKLAVMQPYLFPYIGYWQLMKAADLFVVLDDVNYIRRGWINRNRILLDGATQFFTLPVENASQNRLIMDTKLCFDAKQRENLLRTFKHAYRGKPGLPEMLPLLGEAFRDPQTDLVDFLEHTMVQVAPLLEIDTPILRASRLRKGEHGKGQAGILELCKITGADTYLNPIGGKALYNREDFLRQGITLHFVESQPEQITACIQDTAWDLSVLDLLLRFPREALLQALECYRLC